MWFRDRLCSCKGLKNNVATDTIYIKYTQINKNNRAIQEVVIFILLFYQDE